MSSIEFQHYIGSMRQSYYMMKDFTKFLSIYQKNPFITKEEKEEEEIQRRIEESCKFDKFIEENWDKWCLKDICDKHYFTRRIKKYIIFYKIFNKRG